MGIRMIKETNLRSYNWACDFINAWLYGSNLKQTIQKGYAKSVIRKIYTTYFIISYYLLSSRLSWQGCSLSIVVKS